MEWRRSARGPARLSRAAGAPSGIRAGLQGAEDRGRVRDGQGDVRVGAASTPWPSSTPCTPGTTKPTTSPGGTAVLHGVLQDEQLQLRRVGLPHMLRGHRDLQHTSHTRRLLQNLLGSPHSRPVHESERVWSLQGRDQLRVRSDMHLPEVSSIWGPSQSCRCALSAVQVSLSAREREGERERREREREKRESNYVWPKMCTRHFKEFLHAPSTRGRPSAAPTQTPRADQPGREGRERTHEGRAELLARRELEETN